MLYSLHYKEKGNVVTKPKYPRGAEWRKWDLHIHTPASFKWDGLKFKSPVSPDLDDTNLIDEMIHALNNAEPDVFAIMDYWTFDGYLALRNRLEQTDAPKLKKTVFPGIELRLEAPQIRLNAHVLFSDEIEAQILNEFKSNLKIALSKRSLSNIALQDYAKYTVGNDKLEKAGYKKENVIKCNEVALNAGQETAEITCESYQSAIESVPNNMAIGFMPFSTSGGLQEIDWEEYYAYTLNLFGTSLIFETRDLDLWASFAGIKNEFNKTYIDDFQKALNNIPRLAVSGSDAHRFIGTHGNNDERGYGDYPSGKCTWIKADPTFEGLKQAIREPANRSFIGEPPLGKNKINENKSVLIDSVKINKVDNSTLSEKWLDKTELSLNADLVAIIGNKGSGKSALADIIALLGNSKQGNHFSFLKKDRFRGRTGDPAKQFEAQIKWADEKVLQKNLSENIAIDSFEFVKYIPQGHFEELCASHVLGESNAFEKELTTVIFSHVDDATRLGALNFDQLIELREKSLGNRLNILRNELKKINHEIVSIEDQMSDKTKQTIEEKLLQQKRLLKEHENNKPEKQPDPTYTLSQPQQHAAIALSKISEEIDAYKIAEQKNHNELTHLYAKKQACKNIHEQIDLVNRSIEYFHVEIENDSKVLGIDSNKIIKLNINSALISEIEAKISSEESKLNDANNNLVTEKNELTDNQKKYSDILDQPQQDYQKYLNSVKAWEEKKNNLQGAENMPDSILGLNERLKQLDSLPSERKNLQEKRKILTKEIFNTLDKQRNDREELFKPLHKLISDHSLIRDKYKLQFKAELDSNHENISERIFSMVKQNIGIFRGGSDSFSVIKNLADEHDLSNESSLIEFIDNLHNELEKTVDNSIGIKHLMRKGHLVNEIYDFLFGLEYIQPRYTLMFQNTPIEQLSPGQRGSLLLIFYLFVDKSNRPIIIDQPEENLDNQTVFELLAPVIKEAKKIRQIIIVTHNPNLAVVCDAEQIIHCEFDRDDEHSITYTSGAIECDVINTVVVNVLEGTMPAFENRKNKYQEKRK